MYNISIAILDTFINWDNVKFEGKVNQMTLDISQENFVLKDRNYHATAMCGEIINHCSNSIIDVYPVFGNKLYSDASNVVGVLKDIYKRDKKYNIIMLSLGIDGTDYAEELALICNGLFKKGTIIISAFNNHGGFSYPACLDDVIGVDVSGDVKNIDDFFMLKESPINIVCSSSPRRVLLGDTIGTMAGTSISTAYITGKIANLMEKGIIFYEDIMNEMQKMALKVIQPQTKDVEKFIYGHNWMKCAVFPYSKEIETLVSMEQYLKFEVNEIYDFNRSIYIGSMIENKIHRYIVKKIKNIDWNSFDILVIGHVDRYINISEKVKQEIENIIKLAICNNKIIYCFDSYFQEILKDYHYYFAPSIVQENIPTYNNGRLWRCPVPVVSILGTGPRQGKYSTQIKLINKFEEKGYKVGSIGTEPSGYLFGMDYVFPYGYNSNVQIPVNKYSKIFNYLVHNLYMEQNDIIVTALQSGVLPLNYGREEEDLGMQYSILYGINPDIIVLCIYPNESIQFIKRIVEYLKAVFQVSIFLFLVYPIRQWIDDSGIRKSKDVTQDKEYKEKILLLKKELSQNIFEMNDEGYEKAYQFIIDMLC